MIGTELDDAFLRRTVQLLDEGVQRIAGEDAVRLRHARERALEPRSRWSLGLPAGALALASTAALILGLQLFRSEAPVAPVPELQHLELLAAADSLQFYEDLEFLQWLEYSGNAYR